MACGPGGISGGHTPWRASRGASAAKREVLRCYLKSVTGAGRVTSAAEPTVIAKGEAAAPPNQFHESPPVPEPFEDMPTAANR